jgi:hypothetical protein
MRLEDPHPRGSSNLDDSGSLIKDELYHSNVAQQNKIESDKV